MPELTKHTVERHKAICEYLKYLTTLSTGSIVLLVSFLEKLFTQPEMINLVGISLVGFMITVVASVLSYSVAVFHVGQEMSNMGGNLLGGGLFIAWISFLLAVISLTGFALANIF